MTDQLTRRLRDAVPEPPDLTGLAQRAEDRGRRRRRTVLATRSVGLVVAVLLVVALPILDLGGDDRPEPAPAPQAPSSCSDDYDSLGMPSDPDEVAWVWLCEPRMGSRGTALYRPGALAGEAARELARRWGTAHSGEPCEPGVPALVYRLQVGLIDGNVLEIAGQAGCPDDTVFTAIEGALMARTSDQLPAGEASPEPFECPEAYERGSTPDVDLADGDSVALLGERALTAAPLLPLPAIGVDGCAYTMRGRSRMELTDRWQVTGTDAEELRAALTTGYVQDRTSNCLPDAGAPAHLLVLHDRTGTQRAVLIDVGDCGVVTARVGIPVEDAYLGRARPDLLDLVEEVSSR